MLRTAIIGLGWWGQTLVNSVQGKSDALRFVAAQVRNPARAEAFCKEKDITLFSNIDDVLGDPSIDAVVLATPHSEHARMIPLVAAANKHVFCEKPFTLDLPSADNALAAVKSAGVVVGVGFQRRFPPSIMEIRTRIKDGSLGIINHVEGEATAPAGLMMAKDSWRANPDETPAGAMTALGIHVLDGLIDLAGEIDEVYCVNVRRANEMVDDTTSIMLRFKSGATGNLFCCLTTAPSYRIAVWGSKQYAEASRPMLDVLRVSHVPGPPGSPPRDPEVIETKGFDPIRAELEAFAVAASGGAPYPISPSEIRHGVAAFEAIVRSAKEGKPVKVA